MLQAMIPSSITPFPVSWAEESPAPYTTLVCPDSPVRAAAFAHTCPAAWELSPTWGQISSLSPARLISSMHQHLPLTENASVAHASEKSEPMVPVSLYRM